MSRRRKGPEHAASTPEVRKVRASVWKRGCAPISAGARRAGGTAIAQGAPAFLERGMSRTTNRWSALVAVLVLAACGEGAVGNTEGLSAEAPTHAGSIIHA